jgi:serine/threonine-protein kinase
MRVECTTEPAVLLNGRYRLLEAAGRGGMAEIHRAEVIRGGATGEIVAVKRILPDLANDPESHQMFEDEARMTAMFRHPNIVRFEDYGRDVEGPYLVLEWVDGGSARDLVSSAFKPLEPEGAASIALDVLRALIVLHQGRAQGARVSRLPVIHRDVSLSNVLVTTHGDAKLADFGLARSLAHPRTQPPGTARGKLGYLPPEVLAGGPHGVRGDLYSVGCVFWEALTGRSMFAELPTRDRLRALAGSRRPPIRSVRPDVTPELARVIDSALAFDPADRPANAEAMSHGVLDALGPVGVALGNAAVARRVNEVARRRAEKRRSISPVSDAEVANLLASTMRAIGQTTTVALGA